ncbi:Hypothetical protein SRAE_2000233800 [Strongyloides ratti]|uniref:NADAR domain-containing protein n=1 Tax=Strongyloides ratti TaxID=34506 RepID=A0A090LD46_STRRB|nr:Hypothetical protein SRAE_2000233800 [Strongyloides ratti]CEF67677.1 Hypothetical protein SRAE_2000233800 [Strongyloides ratti]
MSEPFFETKMDENVTLNEDSLNIPQFEDLTITGDEIGNNNKEGRPQIPILSETISPFDVTSQVTGQSEISMSFDSENKDNDHVNKRKPISILMKNNPGSRMANNERGNTNKRLFSEKFNNDGRKSQHQKKPKKDDSKILQILSTPQIFPANLSTMEFTIDFNNIVYIGSRKSIYSPMHDGAPFNYFGKKSSSVDDVYQEHKLRKLCGNEFAMKYYDYKTLDAKRNFIRNSLKFSKVTKNQVIDWKNEEGFDVIFNATFEKFFQNEELLNKMKDDKDKLIVNIYGDDPIDGCGDFNLFTTWIENNKGKKCVLPAQINPTNLDYFPTFGGGKNIQGVMVMLVRYQISIEKDW